MKRNWFAEGQIIGHPAGIPVYDLCGMHGLSYATVYKWKAKFGGIDISEAQRLKGLADDDARLERRLVFPASIPKSVLGNCVTGCFGLKIS